MIRTVINEPKTIQILMDSGVSFQNAKAIVNELKLKKLKNENNYDQGILLDSYTTDEMMALIPSPNQVIYNTDTKLLMVWTNDNPDNPDSNKHYRWLHLELAEDEINNKEIK